MTQEFDRGEAFRLFAERFALIGGHGFSRVIEQSIEAAQAFETAMQEYDAPEQIVRESFGQFVPHGTTLYFLTKDGQQIAIHEYRSVAECAAAAISQAVKTETSDGGVVYDKHLGFSVTIDNWNEQTLVRLFTGDIERLSPSEQGLVYESMIDYAEEQLARLTDEDEK
ncbi:hypothetical protein Lepto7376_3124 [[Leptolyngbya] sp. PCC 7376]|uniref:hypothetical protein n=1 Tax=[Leptolyngbya] sp. PCC 7376 TaxID=111781 RepID=UPI00029F1AD9|nr:hypothetical protein [[Leptolyngbya] sp. PCC 7376]AFY39361.1 hypothetical protein Lepto7376_3124 [[Leptolyngbya] sp. PCC 7376]